MTATDKGFLPPRLTTSQRDAIASPAEGLTIFNTDVNCLQWYNGTGWFNACDGTTIGLPITSGPCTGEPSVFTFNGLEYKPIESEGACWLDRNLGASQVSTQPTDDFTDVASYTASQSNSFGALYQWGRAADGHQVRSSPLYSDVLNGVGVANFNSPGGAWDGEFILRDSGDDNWVDPSVSGVDNLWLGVNGTNNPCPSGYRVPTEAEWDSEQLSWAPNDNAAGAFASPLKLPAAGARANSNGGVGDVGFGFYWSSTVSGSDAVLLAYDSSFSVLAPYNRATAVSVRCIKD